MFKVSSSGNFNNMERFLKKAVNGDIFSSLEKYGAQGVGVLANATPRESGITAASWTYKVTRTSDSYTIAWYNTHEVGASAPLAIMLQLGHGTGTGGYVQGRDYINPAMRPIFDRMAEEAWREVTK